MIEQLQQPGAWIELALLVAAYYLILNTIRGTRGAAIVKGVLFLFVIAFLGLMYLANLLELVRIKTLLDWLLAVLALAVVVVFVPEIRRGLSIMARNPFLSPLLRTPASREVADVLVSAAARLSKNRIGALVAIERGVGLEEYIENGVRIGAPVTAELLETIFYPGTALHDGAVILQGDLVAGAGCLLPLTDAPSLSKSMGTRHRAALGLTEETDALALVVSEETGRISLAVDGKLENDLSREKLQERLKILLFQTDWTGLPRKKEKPPEPAPGAEPAVETGNGPVTGGENIEDAPTKKDTAKRKKPPEEEADDREKTK